MKKETWFAGPAGRLPAWARTPEFVRFVRYGLIGGLTTVVNFGLFAVLHGALGWADTPANVAAVLCAVAFAYLANKWVVFRTRCLNRRDLLREAVSFFTARGVTMAVEIAGLPLLTGLTGFSEYWIKAALTVLVILLNYVFARLFIFRQKGEPAGGGPAG